MLDAKMPASSVAHLAAEALVSYFHRVRRPSFVNEPANKDM